MARNNAADRELRLLFAGDGQEGFTVRAEPSWAPGLCPAAALGPLLDNDDYEELRWYLVDYLALPDGGSTVRARRVERSIGQWGRAL